MHRPNPARPLRALAASALVVGAIALGACSPPASSPSPSATDSSPAKPNAEEQRVAAAATKKVAAAQIAVSGLAEIVDGFRAALKGEKPDTVVETATKAGTDLWARAVATAQGTIAELPAAKDEDRGLYWARLTMRVALEDWAGGHGDRGARLADAVDALEYASRGYGDATFTADGARHVMLSGFDPFGDWKKEPFLSNPSGAIALHLDGRTIDTPQGPVVFQAVMLPVSWAEFDRGVVERAYAPVLAPGDADADVVATISQGVYPEFSIEQWAGAFRDGAPDNRGEGAPEGFREEVPAATGFPQPPKTLQFIETTLPYEAMIAAGTTPSAVKLNPIACTSKTEARGDDDTTCDIVPPAPDALAASGSGGAYLSNESMYRANRLRIGLGRDDVRGGHLHTPVPDYTGVDDTGRGEAFEAQRHAVVDQAQALLLAAATAG
ncbi:hypothetical protein [Microbacterium sp. p3-SID336]|uniref:hypothetical protein n=1 Tax=Microbacterium sp. p3-SID336 TaxID=2916212 RepID=UPI0021A3E928|nr:hypothetical protein [Microbacterium sp. p3-SID336]MCT1476734.1 hypothetical protein [Microbacterium sp. p3-SID336]